MALIIPPGFAQATIPFQHALVSREAVITFGVDVSDAGGDYVAAADRIMEAWDDTFGAYIDSQCAQGPVRLRVGQDGGDPITVEGATVGATGAGNNQLPSNCAVLVRKRTGLGGRRGRGRFYIPWGVAESGVDDAGMIDVTDHGSYNTLAALFHTNLELGPPALPMVLLHDSSGIGTEPSPTVVTSLDVDRMIATQRRRLGR